MSDITEWYPSRVLTADKQPTDFCLIVLNQPLNSLDTFDRLWHNARYKFLADGGSNRVYDAFKHDQQTLNKYIPDEIRGDLDSIRPDVKDFYASKNVKITRVSDQDSTDFMKCVDLLREKEAQDHKTYDIVAMPALGGRFDQTMASINLLYFLKNEKDRRTILVSDESLTVLLDKGKHHIHCQPEYEGPTCGVMPIGAPAILTTKGLRWNLENYECFFGGMVSTSNVIDSKLIEIDTNSPVVWTIEINLQK